MNQIFKCTSIKVITILIFISFKSVNSSVWATNNPQNPVKLENPVTVEYLKKNLKKTSPRLVLNSSIEAKLRGKIKTDQAVLNYYEAIKLNAQKIMTSELLTRKMEGRRLLGTSREMLYRMNILAMVYRLEKDSEVLKRINNELIAVCNFADWNPSHYLDVAEMSMAVAIAVDWTENDLPRKTVDLAINALIEKGIKPSYATKGMSWINNKNNWNQVCNGGMIAASIVIANKDIELAAKTISRSLEGMPYALHEYLPDGVYPEGSTYWGYGTSFSVITSSMLSSAFGTDFGLANYPAFLESAKFRKLSVAPSGWYYNFADCGDKSSEEDDITMAWFANKTGNSVYFDKSKLLIAPEKMGKLTRLAGAGLVWLSEYEPKTGQPLPVSWKGDGANPIVIFRNGDNDPLQYYFGGKGGKATTSHGNMDAGSFIFELDSVRWSIDPGNQSYNEIELTGFDLWGNCQTCQRWTLLTKNNFGHSTMSVNDELFINDGYAPLLNFDDGSLPEAIFDMKAVYGENIESATRRFLKEDNKSITIEDKFIVNKNTKQLVWQMITTADVETVKGGAILKQNGKKLSLVNISNPELQLSVISLDPPPFYLDRKIEGLKRIEFRIPAYILKNNEGFFKVKLSGMY